MEYKLYPNLWSTPPENPQVVYHVSVIQAKMQGLKNKEQMFKQKYEKYTKILNWLTWLNACSSRISIATGISSVATFATFIELPVSISLGAASLTGAIASGIISTLTKKYQKKLKKVTKLIDIITPALVVFERVISGALKNGLIDEEELKYTSDITPWNFKRIDWCWSQDGSGEQIPSRKKLDGRNKRTEKKSKPEPRRRRNKCLIACSLSYLVCYFKNR